MSLDKGRQQGFEGLTNFDTLRGQGREEKVKFIQTKQGNEQDIFIRLGEITLPKFMLRDNTRFASTYETES